ncbi:unnamed protein product [Amoebophrya sp. A25]|nr:unnamed protein product [Amoebophrya sp. A25]|eukprot:GSA25T00007309001.1
MTADDRTVVIVGASSKHDQDGQGDLPPEARWGLGGALALAFAKEGFHIVLTSRRVSVLEQLAEEVRKLQDPKYQTICVSCDVTQDDAVQKAFEETIKSSLPATAFIDCLIFNASPAFPPNFSFGQSAPKAHELDPAYMTHSFDVSVNGLIRCLKYVIPGMEERKRGCILLSGATMQLRGGANFAALAPGKTALRSLGQSMFQAYGPLGIHVCNINVDGVIDSANTRKWMGAEKLMKCDEIAQQYVAMYKQPKTVWSFELQITPDWSAPTVGMRM